MNHHFMMGKHGILSYTQVLGRGNTCSVGGIYGDEAEDRMRELIACGVPGVDLRPMPLSAALEVSCNGPMCLLELEKLEEPAGVAGWTGLQRAPLWAWMRTWRKYGAIAYNYDVALQSFVEYVERERSDAEPWLIALYEEACSE